MSRNENFMLAELSIQRCVRCSRLFHFDDCASDKSSRHGVSSKCRPCVRAISRERYAANPHAAVAASLAWKKRNPEKAKQFRATRMAKPNEVMHARVRTALHRMLGGKKGGRTTASIIGYSSDELAAHIQRQFLPRMGWHNRGEWHIDHIVPLSSFDFARGGLEAVQRAWALPNLRPLWALDNRRKGKKQETLL